jgi:hypothetical protein
MAKMNHRKGKERDQQRDSQVAQWERKAHKNAQRKAAWKASYYQPELTQAQKDELKRRTSTKEQMFTKPPQKPQPTPGSFTKALDQIFEGKVPDQMLKEHEERPKTRSEAMSAMWNLRATVKDIAHNMGFREFPEIIADREARKALEGKK